MRTHRGAKLLDQWQVNTRGTLSKFPPFKSREKQQTELEHPRLRVERIGRASPTHASICHYTLV